MNEEELVNNVIKEFNENYDGDFDCCKDICERVRRDALDKERQRVMVIIDERGLLDHIDFDIAEEIKKELEGL